MRPANSKSGGYEGHDLEHVAADWLVRRQDGLGPAEALEFERWLQADVRHAASFERLEAAWQVLNEPRSSGRAHDLGRELGARQRRRRKRTALFSFGSAGLVAAALTLAFISVNPLSPPPAAATVTVRPDRQDLPDGSTVELNAGTQLAVDYSPVQRGVRLIAGEALFAVVKDPARPFIVTAGGVTIRAVGTAFSVRHSIGQVDVVVTEGRVAVERTPESAALASPRVFRPVAVAYVDAGAKVVVTPDLPPTAPLVIEEITPHDVSTEHAWRDKRVELSSTPLAEAVALFNRYNRIQISVPNTSLAQHQLSGIFWADDPEGFVRLLETGMGMSAERTGDTILLRPPIHSPGAK